MPTVGDVLNEARTLLQDKAPDGELRYSDAELLEAFNGFMAEVRAKRPDLFLTLGLRNPVPRFLTSQLTAAFPLDMIAYDAFVYYVVGRCEMREDTFTEDSRAVVMSNKAISQLLQVAS